MTNKVYADGNGPVYTYTPNGNLATRIWARGIVTTYSYDGWNNLTNTAYSDGTPSIALAYDAMGRQVSATAAAGTTVTAYNDYGEVVSEATTGLYGKTLAHHRDAFGRDLGYTIDNSRKSIIEYEADTARMKRVMMAGAWFTYYYLPGTDLKSRLQYGGSGSAYYTYEPSRDLLTQVQNYINGGVISQYDYVNDAAGRRTAITRSGSMMSETRTDYYGYNDRNELISATKNTEDTEYQYSYDDIGNRLSSLDLGTNRTYVADALNQYTQISNFLSSVSFVADFTPQFDLDGNQTLIKTATGVWQVTYNGENRPVLWECGTTNITMKFDRMGRRVEYIETVNSTTNTHHRFVYDGYLCIQRLNAAANNAIDLVFGWDPSEPVATRPLWMQRVSGSYNFFYFHDGNKNVSELVSYQSARGVPAHYEYAPFGAVTAATTNTAFTVFNAASTNPYRFSSEYADDALGLVYYNYRHYNVQSGRWMNYDRYDPAAGYVFVRNDGVEQTDFCGLVSSSDTLKSPDANRQPTQGRACTYLVYVAHGVSDPQCSLWEAFQSRKYPDSPNGDRYGYWGCGANVFYEMTKNDHSGFELPVELPKNGYVDPLLRDALIAKGIPRNYAEKYEKIPFEVHPYLVKTVDKLKQFAKTSGDMKRCCSSVTIKIKCSDALRNGEVFDFLSKETQDQLRFKTGHDAAAHAKAYKLYFDKYKEKVLCGATIKVE